MMGGWGEDDEMRMREGGEDEGRMCDDRMGKAERMGEERMRMRGGSC